MSRGFVKEGDQEEIPVVPPRAYLPKGMPNYVTHEGLQALNDEMLSLKNELVASNDNYVASNFIKAKMKLLAERINTAVEVDVTKANQETVSFGAYVKYNGWTFRIVGVDEANFTKGLLSFISPVAKALMGKKVGDRFEIKIPRGTEMIEVQGIWYEAVPLTILDVETDPVLNNITPKPKKTITTESRTQIVQEVETNIVNADVDTSLQDENPDIFTPEENIMEFLPVVNERGIIVGRALHMELHKGNKILHPVVHMHVINNKGVTTYKYWWHVAFGDTPEKTLKRKLSETLGLSGIKPKLKKQYVRETKIEKELVYVFAITTDAELLKTPEDKDYLEVFIKD